MYKSILLTLYYSYKFECALWAMRDIKKMFFLRILLILNPILRVRIKKINLHAIQKCFERIVFTQKSALRIRVVMPGRYTAAMLGYLWMEAPDRCCQGHVACRRHYSVWRVADQQGRLLYSCVSCRWRIDTNSVHVNYSTIFNRVYE